MPQSLTSKTVHGIKWSYASMIVNAGLQIGITAALARLLVPSQFGLVAMAGVFVRFGQYLAQMGVSQALVQKSELSADDSRTAFTASLLMGIALCATFAMLAPLAGLLFPDAEGVVEVACVLSLTFVIGGLSAPSVGLLQRRFAFRAIALAEIVSYAVGYGGVGLALAAAGLGAWSLVAAILTSGALLACLLGILSRRQLGLGLNSRSFRAIYSFGWRISLIGFAEFVGSNLDTIWTGRYLGSAATGLYTRATNIANVSLYNFTVSLSRVLLPGYSRIQTERERLKRVYVASITVAGSIVIPVAWGLAGSASEIVSTLLGSQWMDAAPVLAILAIAVPFSLLSHFTATLCDATARLNIRIGITAARIIWLGIMLAVFVPFGIVGIAIAYAASEMATHAAYLLAARRMLSVSFLNLRHAYRVGLTAGAITGIATFSIHAVLGGLGWAPLAILFVQVTTGLFCLVITISRCQKGLVWLEIRGRLSEAGHGPTDRDLVGRAIRTLDYLSPQSAPRPPEDPSD